MHTAAPTAIKIPSHWTQWVNSSPKMKYAVRAPPMTMAASHMMQVHIIVPVRRA